MKKLFIFTAITVFLMNTCFSLNSVASEQRYLNKRSNIIKENGYNFPVKLTDDEKIVDKKLSNMKEELLKTYNYHFPYNFPILFDKRLTDSNLYRFSEKLPKGGDLHVHGSELMPAPGYFDYISENKRVYICNQKGDKYGAIIYVKPNEVVPEGYISFMSALDKKIFTREQLLRLWTLSPNGYPTQADAWDYFEPLFENVDVIKQLEDEQIRKFYYIALKKYCENNILHIEFHRSVNSDIEKERRMASIIRQAYYDVKKEYPDFSLRIIGTGLKTYAIDMKQDLKSLVVAKKMQSEIKDEFDKNNIQNFFIGYDLVNEEDSSRSLLDYHKYLQKYRSKDFNLYLHAGESLRTTNYNLVDAYLLKSKRVGHGYNLYMFPKLLEKYKRANIALEVCPISNIRLGYVSDLRQHPAIEYMKRNIPIVIASDDPTFFENQSLTDDWFAIIMAFDLSLAEIKQLCRNSIIYSGVSKKEKAKLMSAWHRQWQTFIDEYRNY